MVIYAAIYIFTIISMSAEMGWILAKANRSRQMFSLVACQLLLNIWSLSQLIMLEAANEHQLYISYCVGNTGICWIGTAWLMFSFFTAKKNPPKTVTVFTVLFSAVLWTASLTNKLHGLFYSSFSMDGVEHGILFYFNIVFTYFCMLAGTIMLCKSIASDKKRRRQLILLILSAVIPFISNILNLFGIVEIVYDVTPLAFSVSSVLVLLATNRFGFLNVNELAFDKALESISEGVAVFGINSDMTYSNETVRKFFGIAEGCSLDEFYNALGTEQRKALENNSEGFCETEFSMKSRVFNVKQYRHSDKKGKRLALTFIASDVTRFYEMARQKQALSEAKEKLAVEAERNRIAQEVHDTAGHTLTMINSLAKLTDISVNSGDYEAASTYAKEAQQLSSQGIAQLRVSINNLRKKSENSLITEGLKQLAESVRGIEAELCIQGEDSQKYSFCSNIIYENTREAITNCVKYSGADRIDIVVKLLGNSVEVYIFDNGRGCRDIICGNGLRGMRERTEKAGGTIKFSSPEGCGFSIAMKFTTEKGENL